MFLLKKIKSLEDALVNSKLPLEKPFDSSVSIDSVASVPHAMLAFRTMFVKPNMSQHHT
jgi:hypothetical protein